VSIIEEGRGREEESRRESGTVMLDSHLSHKSDIFHLNNKNNQLERQVWPPKDVP